MCVKVLFSLESGGAAFWSIFDNVMYNRTTEELHHYKTITRYVA